MYLVSLKLLDVLNQINIIIPLMYTVAFAVVFPLQGGTCL